ncbi:MAG: glycosyltransferase family 4 protein [Lachnospiraceae bacterium]|nr:glycosyltransferase family 4 protein [Lachnospiraceae bacterium]
MKSYCIFAAQYLPHMGGVENYTYNLSKKLIEKGNKVIVVTNQNGDLPAYEVMEGITIYRLPCLSLMNGRYPILKCNKEFRKINRILKKKHFDMVIVNTRFYIHSVYGARFAKKQGIPCIILDHGSTHLTVHNRLFDVLGGWVEHFLTMIVKHYCRDFYGVSMASVEWLKHFHIEGKGTIYNAIDLGKINQTLENPVKDYRNEYGIPEDGVVVTFTGRLIKEKGILQLIQAVKRINRINDKVYLFLAGDGDEEETVARESNKNIIPLGRLSFEEVIALLRQSDIFDLPSDSEGFPTSVLEAVACHCYIIVTERGGAKELIAGDAFGTVIPDNNPDTVYESLFDCINHGEQRKIAEENAYKRLKENFTWDIVSDKVLEL